ncbi:MAG: hypothetical protein EXS51_03545 [Candidatus Taylorbacteria bacterium]|nr:hypothetical protein [Candidatus Taylorbacteria bacterium]
MASISDLKLREIRSWYYRDFLSVKDIADKVGVSIDSVVYFMRQHGLKRRTLIEASRRRFERKPLSFSIARKLSASDRSLKVIGAMLYWCEGFKGNEKSTNSTVDLANSDPKMISLFLNFLRRIYRIDEKRLRVLLYCYSDQNIPKLKAFWSGTTGIPLSQFSKPYVRHDFRIDGRKMKHGMVHVRYSDKKLLIELKNLIDSVCGKYAPVA